MLSVLRHLGTLIQIVALIEASREAIKAAEKGKIVPCGVARGIKAFGRRLDLPLNPIVRD